MNGAILRVMREEDVPDLLELERICFPDPWTAGMFITQIRLDDLAVNIVATEEGAITGYVTGWIGYRELHILSIGVIPEKRGSGIADTLLSAVIERSRKEGCERAILEVRRGNERARRFYSRRGFREIGVRRRYYANNGEDAVVMELDI